MPIRGALTLPSLNGRAAKRAFQIALTVALTAASPAALAAPGCNITGISGTWLISVDAVWADDYVPELPAEFRETCWLTINPSRNVGVHCEETALFGLSWDPDVKPWHQIERGSTSRAETVNARRFPVPNRCEWRLFDRNDLDIEYTIYFSPDYNTLLGHGEGFADKHYGSTEPYTAFFTGIRQ